MKFFKAVIIACIIFSAAPSFTEVIIQEDGSVVLGKITNVDSAAITIDSFGKSQRIPINAIRSNNKDVAALKTTKFNVILKDDTVISGYLDNYDEEIGVLLNMGFGTITIPSSGINMIQDASVAKQFSGFTYKLGLGFGGYKVLGNLSKDYGSSFTGNAYGELMLPFMRGLFLGVDMSYRSVNYKANSKMKYNIVSLKPYLQYSFLDFKKLFSVFSRVTPFVSLYAGSAYIALDDKRSYIKDTSKSEVAPEISAALGLDILITEKVSLRAACTGSMIFQKNKNYQDLAGSLGVNYGI